MNLIGPKSHIGGTKYPQEYPGISPVKFDPFLTLKLKTNLDRLIWLKLPKVEKKIKPNEIG